MVGFRLRPTPAAEGAFTGPLRELPALTARGVLKPVVHEPYPLTGAARALADVLARRTTGKVLLRP